MDARGRWKGGKVTLGGGRAVLIHSFLQYSSPPHTWEGGIDGGQARGGGRFSSQGLCCWPGAGSQAGPGEGGDQGPELQSSQLPYD